MEGRELRRSYTQVDFPTQRGVRPHYHQNRSGGGGGGKQQRHGQQQQHQRMKFPTQEIYRPPSQREGGTPAGKLNVHAKEFSPTSTNLPLQNSKSTGSILTTVHNEGRHRHKNVGFPLSNSKTVHNQFPQLAMTNASTGSSKVGHGNDRDTKAGGGFRRELQRSKSTTSALPSPHIDFSIFGKKAPIVEAAYSNPAGLRAPVLLDLAKLITEKAQENRAWAESLASLSFYLIEREKQTTFIEGLLNILQYIVGKKCKDGSAGDSFYFPFISFLHSLYGESYFSPQTLPKSVKAASSRTDLVQKLMVKPKRIEYEKNGRSPALTLLTLLVEVCIDFLHQEKLTGRKETEVLFFVVTTIGRDLENDSPKQMEGLMSAVRDAFLSEGTTAPIRRTLLQLVELKAARWQLPARTIHYYQTYLSAA